MQQKHTVCGTGLCRKEILFNSLFNLTRHGYAAEGRRQNAENVARVKVLIAILLAQKCTKLVRKRDIYPHQLTRRREPEGTRRRLKIYRG
jgi:hypothetical protein